MSSWVGAWVCVCCFSGVANGDERSEVTRPKTGFGSSDVDVLLKMGASGYTGALGDVLDVGPMLGVSIDTRNQKPLGLEVSYDGTRNAVSDDYILDAGSIWQHTVSVLVKGGPSFDDFFPFVAGGVGASYVDATDLAELEGFKNDILAEVPLALGLDYRLGPIAAGVRGTYRVVFGEGFADGTRAQSAPSGNALAGTMSVGGRF